MDEERLLGGENEEKDESCCSWLAADGDDDGEHSSRCLFHDRHSIGSGTDNWEFRVNIYSEFRFVHFHVDTQ